MAKIDDSVKKKVPELRFPGFTDDWEERKLGEIGSFKNGMNFGKDAMGHGSPFVNLQNIFGKNIVDDTTLELAESTEKQKVEYSLIKGDVLFIRSSVKPSGVGEAALVDSNLPDTTYSGFIIRFRPKIDIDNNFKRFAFGTKYVRNQIMARATSSANTNINQDSLSLIQVGLPNLKEQEKIGSFFKQLDATIALHQRKLDLLKEQKKGFLQKMFPKNGEKVPELRFAGFADDWEERKFKDILKTHSFRSYLAGVSENGEYEVIQQGDKPIVGYSDGEPFTDYKDVTLFGDHTVSLYKPKSPFFVATDGVKILSADNFEGNYLYTTLERYKPEPQGYKRHFTILKNQDVWFTENMEEQQKIGVFFKQLDATITLHQRKS